MSRMVTLLIALGLSIATPAAFGATIHVPGDSATIQAGINGAVTGDTVLVADGTYTGDGNRDIDFGGKNIVLKSENGPEFSIIDCEGSEMESHRGFYFHNGEDSTARVEGFTVKNALNNSLFLLSDEELASVLEGFKVNNHLNFGLGNGGAIICEYSSSPTIQNCVFIDNEAGFGGGMCIWSSYPTVMDCSFIGSQAGYNGGAIFSIGGGATITNCRFVGNTAVQWGGGLFSYQSDPLMTNCCFIGNHAVLRGGGVYYYSFYGPTESKLTNCTLVKNSTDGFGGAIACEYHSSPTLENCIIAFSAAGEAVYCSGPEDQPVLQCCNIFGNAGGDWVGCIAGQAGINGNFSLDPLFCDTASGDYSLFVLSPCAPANNSCGVLIGALDVGCTGPKALIDPDTMYAFQVHTIDTTLASVYFGDFVDGHTVNDIDPATMMVNGTLPPLSWQILPSHPDFVGEVMEITFTIRDFILSYGPLWDTTIQVYTVSGEFNGKCGFSIDGEVTMFGHTSGDVNGDGRVNVADLTYLVDFLFNGGAEPPIPETADLDHNGAVNVADVAELVRVLF